MVLKRFKKEIFRILNKFGRRFIDSYVLNNPLTGDRCIEYSFVVKNLVNLDRLKYKKILDIGCFASPLTPIIKELGYTVDGIDLLPTPYIYEGINFYQGNFLVTELNSFYDVIILCSTIEHVGLKRRYGSPNITNGDIKTLEKVTRLLNHGGILILTIPYGKEKTIYPLHRVYNINSKLLKHAFNVYEVINTEFYKTNEENIWIKCDETEARNVNPSANNYALGLFVFKKK